MMQRLFILRIREKYPEKRHISESNLHFFLNKSHCAPCSNQRVTLRTGRNVRGGCGTITTDCPFSLALLTEPQVGHCTS